MHLCGVESVMYNSISTLSMELLVTALELHYHGQSIASCGILSVDVKCCSKCSFFSSNTRKVKLV